MRQRPIECQRYSALHPDRARLITMTAESVNTSTQVGRWLLPGPRS